MNKQFLRLCIYYLKHSQFKALFYTLFNKLLIYGKEEKLCL